MKRVARDLSWDLLAFTRVCLIALGMLALSGICATQASAQTTTTFTNSADSATNGINETATPCTTRFTRTFSVGSSFIVGDVDIGVLAAHTWRADLAMYLVSPAGTRVQLNSGVGASAVNFNALFDDEAASAITAYTANATATAATAVPPYAANFRPSASLAAFDGQNAAGIWTLEICDQAAQDSGTFYQADLYLTSVPTVFADLSAAISVDSASPATGSQITYTVTVANASSSASTATGVVVRDLLPTGASYVSSSGSGTYNSATGDWTIGTLTPGQSVSLTIVATVTATAGTTVTNTAEIFTSSVADLDSTPGNGVVGEDDLARVNFTATSTRVAGTAPVLTCPAGTTLFDWDGQSWATGSTSNSYTISGVGSVAFSLANPGAYINNATLGGQSPARQNGVTGGLVPAEFSLAEVVDLADLSQTASTTITLGNVVPGVQFRIFDVDYGAGQFADKVTVTGYRGGTTVSPTLTNGVSNYVIGNSAYGDSLSADTSANGNVVVTFSAPVDQIVISYGNHALAPAAPGQQAITIHDLTFCRPSATISATKFSTVISDPTNGTTFPKAIPGAVVEYCILVTNTGPSNATSIAASDSLPANFAFAAGSMKSGNNCAAATTAEDDDATGADESDTLGAAISGSTITMTASSLGGSSTFAVKFRGTVN